MSSQTLLPRLALGTAVASSANAHAAIVVYDTNGAFVNAASNNGYGEILAFGSISLNGTFTNNKWGYYDYTPPQVDDPKINFIGQTMFGGFAAYNSGYPGTIGVSAVLPNLVGLRFLALNEAVSPTSGFNGDSAANQSLAGFPSGTVYLGLAMEVGESAVHYGWLELSKSGNVISIPRFAFNDVAGQSILAGQTTAVPEASTLGLVGGLFGLVAAAHVRRRKQKQAAASDTFLALAAGERLN